MVEDSDVGTKSWGLSSKWKNKELNSDFKACDHAHTCHRHTFERLIRVTHSMRDCHKALWEAEEG